MNTYHNSTYSFRWLVRWMCWLGKSKFADPLRSLRCLGRLAHWPDRAGSIRTVVWVGGSVCCQLLLPTSHYCINNKTRPVVHWQAVGGPVITAQRIGTKSVVHWQAVGGPVITAQIMGLSQSVMTGCRWSSHYWVQAAPPNLTGVHSLNDVVLE